MCLHAFERCCPGVCLLVSLNQGSENLLFGTVTVTGAIKNRVGQETHLRTKDLHRLKVKGWKQIFQANGQEKKAGVAILISDKIDFQRRAIKRDPEGHFIILKGRIHQEDINIVNIYAPNIGAPKYIKKILEDFEKDIHSNTIIETRNKPQGKNPKTLKNMEIE